MRSLYSPERKQSKYEDHFLYWYIDGQKKALSLAQQDSKLF
ncbi:hypothetical protein GCWU000325_01720 [Alloprevotella tannerae ATCC 51259]|uniref:Uncharacterized protein n=1 Tax=Alloprevotella tannerae ATCC 51259 TaxID=626522 RepID=C9LHQ4_9BACT|nr:hypothetical protein GCWU000325_01720 [Alloprevotella tannerae ATCC 51259]